MSPESERTNKSPLLDLVDEEGNPYPPLVRKLILKVLNGASPGPETHERLAWLNEQLEQCLHVCKAGSIPVNLESVLLEVWETLESLDDELS